MAINLDWVTVAAIFLSNIREGLSSAAGMKKAGRSVTFLEFGARSQLQYFLGK
jgi:hypothetical protein